MRIPSLFNNGRRSLTPAHCPWSLMLLAIAGATFAQDRPASTSFAQEGPDNTSRPLSAIRDEADMFSDTRVMYAEKQLREIERRNRIPTVIETVEGLRGQTITDATVRRARQSGGEGIFILIARRDRHLDVLVSQAFTNIVTDQKRLAIRDAFVDGFKQGDFDKGLAAGITMILKVTQGAKLAEKVARAGAEEAPPRGSPSAPTGAGDSSSLVLRNQVRLTLAGAERILAGAQAKAAEMGLKMNIAVVDDGGHMIAFARMDGARPASGYTATTKAVTAATFRAPSGPVPAGTNAPDPLLNLSLQNAALASGGKLTTLYGGVPILVDGQVIGGVGVGGGSGEQDATVARAGIDAFLSELNPGRPDAPREEK